MKERSILHSDANSFFASVEKAQHPEYVGKPLAVCGSTEERHGIVLTKTPEAARFGVKVGMTNRDAEMLCPGLLIVHPHYDLYLRYSEMLREIYLRYTDLVEPFGLDECWLDVSGSTKLFGSAYDIAQEIRKTVKRELGITVSIGVSFNKVFAKLGSDIKKPDAVTEITQENFKTKIWQLDASNLLFVGRATSKALAEHGITTIGELANAPRYFMKNLFGINGLILSEYANGRDFSEVTHKNYVSPIKSFGHGITTSEDLTNNDEVKYIITELSQDIGYKLRKHALETSWVQIAIRNNLLETVMFQTQLDFPTQSSSVISSKGFELFTKNYQWKANIRSVTVRAIILTPAGQTHQTNFFTDYAEIEKKNLLDLTVDGIHERFGKRSVSPASLILNNKMSEKQADELIVSFTFMNH